MWAYIFRQHAFVCQDRCAGPRFLDQLLVFCHKHTGSMPLNNLRAANPASIRSDGEGAPRPPATSSAPSHAACSGPGSRRDSGRFDRFSNALSPNEAHELQVWIAAVAKAARAVTL